ncbi:MAG: SDR family oxidoreductase [Bdellovibrionales bacterium]|nr:SDR family oxidoreductase [Bdellovibrionales bacterium]
MSRESKGVALVTGASVGLGEHFARLFAENGHDLVLVARSRDRLEALAAELRAEHRVQAWVVPADLSRADSAQAVFDEVKEKGLRIEFLVNNAGFGTNGAFLDLPLEKEVEMIDLNCTTLVRLTHLFANGMRARGRGRVMNIASTAGFQPGPYMATYFATKAFVISFTEAIAHELKGTGVTVTCYCPGATRTEFGARSGNDKSRLFQRRFGVAEAADVAADAYAAMMSGRVLAIHGVMNGVMAKLSGMSPRLLARTIASSLNQVPGAK